MQTNSGGPTSSLFSNSDVNWQKILRALPQQAVVIVEVPVVFCNYAVRTCIVSMSGPAVDVI